MLATTPFDQIIRLISVIGQKVFSILGASIQGMKWDVNMCCGDLRACAKSSFKRWVAAQPRWAFLRRAARLPSTHRVNRLCTSRGGDLREIALSTFAEFTRSVSEANGLGVNSAKGLKPRRSQYMSAFINPNSSDGNTITPEIFLRSAVI